MGDDIEYSADPYKIVGLEKYRLGLQMMLSREMIDAKVDMNFRPEIDAAIVNVRGFVWAEQESVKRQEVKYPADWWQAFKERWFPKQLLKRYPVEYKVIVLEAKALYPEFRLALPNEKHSIVIQRHD